MGEACSYLFWIVARFSYGKKGARMEIKDLIGAVVAHKIFGQGIVEDAHDNYIEVFFSQKGKKSKLDFPIVFY